MMLALLVSGAGWTVSCKSQDVRAVVEAVPVRLSHSLEVRGEWAERRRVPEERPIVPEVPSLHDSADGEARIGVSGEEHLWLLSGPMGELGGGGAQLDPELGPIDLGYPLIVDLGAGEAPYDDGVPTIHGVELTRSGFSDTLLQASWRERITHSSMLHMTVAVSRFQDLGMIDGFADMRFAWVVFGWRTSF